MSTDFVGYVSLAEGRPLELCETLEEAKCSLSALVGNGRELLIECKGGDFHGRLWRYDEKLNQWVEVLN